MFAKPVVKPDPGTVAFIGRYEIWWRRKDGTILIERTRYLK